MNTVIQGAGVHHIALHSNNFDKTLEFYTKTLGFKTHLCWGEGRSRQALLDIGDGNFLEVFADGNGILPEGPLFHLALRCENVDEVYNAALAAGAKPKTEPCDVNIPSNPPLPIRIAFFIGFDGDVIELFKTY